MFDPNNPIIQLCAKGMELEGEGKKKEALALFNQAWNDSSNDFEKFTSAHYIARHQDSIANKLKWDKTALELALRINEPELKSTYPSLYLNIAKCHEDMEQYEEARKNYELAFSFANFLPGDGYGNMIRSGISSGLARVSGKTA